MLAQRDNNLNSNISFEQKFDKLPVKSQLNILAHLFNYCADFNNSSDIDNIESFETFFVQVTEIMSGNFPEDNYFINNLTYFNDNYIKTQLERLVKKETTEIVPQRIIDLTKQVIHLKSDQEISYFKNLLNQKSTAVFEEKISSF